MCSTWNELNLFELNWFLSDIWFNWMVFFFDLFVWDCGSLGSVLGTRQHEKPAAWGLSTTRQKIAPKVRFGSILPRELSTDVFFWFSVCGDAANHFFLLMNALSSLIGRKMFIKVKVQQWRWKCGISYKRSIVKHFGLHWIFIALKLNLIQMFINIINQFKCD